MTNVTLDHKTSHKGQFFKIDKLSIDVWFVRIWLIYNYLKIWNLWVQKKNLNIEKIAFKVVQMKFLAMHITNQKLGFDIFTVGKLFSLLNILMIFWHKKKKSKILTHTMYFWLLLSNIPVLLMTGFVVQGHKCLESILFYFILLYFQQNKSTVFYIV